MNKNPLKQGLLTENPVGVGTVSRKMVTEAPGNPEGSMIEAGGAIPQELYALITQQPFFKGLDPHQLQLLADSAMRMHFEAGQSILEEGSPANRFYLILEGAVALESEVKDRGRITIQTLGPGDDLGWSWLFPPFYVHLSARALKPTKTIFFYGTRLREQCRQDHELDMVHHAHRGGGCTTPESHAVAFGRMH